MSAWSVPRWHDFRWRRLLRRIADREAELGIWPPWHYKRQPWYDLHGGAGYDYRLPREDDAGHDFARAASRSEEPPQ